MRRRLTAAAVLLALALTGCAAVSPHVSDADPTAAADDKVHVLLARDMRYANERSYLSPGTVGGFIKSAAELYTKRGLGEIVIDYADLPSGIDSGVGGTGSGVTPDEYYGCGIIDYLYLKYNELKTEGAEPDIVIFAPFAGYGGVGSNKFAAYTEYYRYIMDESLADLAPLMESDASFEDSDCVQAVIDGGKYGGKQLFIPLLYQIASYGGLVERSEESGAPYPARDGLPASFSTFEEFWRQVNAASDYADAQGISLFASQPDNAGAVGYGVCQQLCTDTPILNLSEGTIERDDPAFRAMMRASFSAKGYFGSAEGQGVMDYDLKFVESGKACMSLSFENMARADYTNQMRGYFSGPGTYRSSETPYISGLPSYSDPSKHNAFITLAMGVSASSDSAKESYKFIRWCMDYGTFIDNMRSAAGKYMYPVSLALAREVASPVGTGDAEYAKLCEALYVDATNIAFASPYYPALNAIFSRRFKELYDGSPDHSDPDALTDALCDSIDADLRLYFSN